MDLKDAVIMALIVALALSISLSTAGFGHFTTAESYAHALNVERAVRGAATSENSLFYGFASFAYGLASGGKGGIDIRLLEEGLRLMPALFAVAAVLSAYYALRMKFGAEISGAASILFLASVPFASVFMSNVVSPIPLGIALFIAGFALFATLRRRWEIAVAGGALVGLSALAWNGMILAYFAFSLGLVAELAYRRAAGAGKGNFAKSAGAMLLVPLPFIAFSELGSLPGLFARNGLLEFPQAFLIMALFAGLTLAATIAKATGKRKLEKLDVFALASALFSFAVAPFSAEAALPGFLLSCAISLRDIPALMNGRNSALAGIFALSSYLAIGTLFAAQVPLEPAVLVGLLAGASVAFAASMYEGKRLGEYVRAGVFAMAAAASLSSAIALTYYATDPVSPEMESAYFWIRDSAPPDAVVGVAGGAEIAEYLSQRVVSGDSRLVQAWLLGNGSAGEISSAGITHLVVNGVSAFDNIEALRAESGAGAGVRIDSFLIADIYEEAGGRYIVLQSMSADKIAYLPITQDGDAIDASRDAVLFESSAGSRRVSSARFLLLEGEGGRIYRVLLPYEGYGTNLFRAFFGEVDGLVQDYPGSKGAVRVFRVG